MLRYKSPGFCLDFVDRSKLPTESCPSYRPAPVFDFRRDGDISAIVKAIGVNPIMNISAPMASGKSTRIPAAIAKATGCLVVHTIPNINAAHWLHTYLQTLDNGVRYSFMDDVSTDLPSDGVLLTSNIHYLSKHMQDLLVDAPQHILYLDEYHESDMATYVNRKLSPAFPKIKSVLLATATSNPKDDKAMVLPSGSPVLKLFPDTQVAAWGPYDADMPWSVDNIHDHTLIFHDHPKVRESLYEGYRANGCLAYMLDSHSTYDEVQVALGSFKQPSSRIVVVIVDYSFRSSFTISGPTTVIDSCYVKVPITEDGVPTWSYRRAYGFENRQAFGRCGRVDGDKKVTLFRPRTEPELKMCDVEYSEALAAAMIFRLLGYVPPRELAGFLDLSRTDVPRDILGCLQSATLLDSYPGEEMVSFVNNNKVVKQTDKALPERPAFRAPVGVYRAVSCHTMHSPVVARYSSPPPVPDIHKVHELDEDVLMNMTRPSSPASSAGEPVRIQSHYERLTRLDMSKAPRRRRDDSVSTLELPVHEPALSTNAGMFRPEAMKEFAKLADVSMNEVYSKASSEIPDEDLGNYIMYPGIVDAPRVSKFFPNGIDSILGVVNDPTMRNFSKKLPEPERLSIMRELVNSYNENTALFLGITRVTREFTERDDSDKRQVFDEAKYAMTVQWAIDYATKAANRVRMIKQIFPIFQTAQFGYLEPFTELEQKAMIMVAEKFKYAIYDRDKDEEMKYIDSVNRKSFRLVGGRNGQQKSVAYY